MTAFLIKHCSYLGLAFVLALTGLGLPVPEEIPVVVAGVLASHGQLDPWLAFAACMVGVMGGDCFLYGIGHHFGRNVLRKHRYWAHLVKPEREAQMEQLLHEHALKVLFLARFLVVLRSPTLLTAGILRMPFRRFFLFDLLCATTVVGTFFLLSFYFGQHITGLIRRVEISVTIVVVLALAGAAVYFWRRYRRPRQPPGTKSTGADQSLASRR